jgi:glycosyltransferase involved in cell wall biosynthesis
MNTIIDASGVGIGGIRLFLEGVVKNWPPNEDLLVVGVERGYASHLQKNKKSSLRVIEVSKNRVIGICQTALAINQNRSKNSRILAMSPSICSLIYGDNSTLMVHDFMFIDKPEFVSKSIRIYRRISYNISIRKCKKLIFVSETTKNRFYDLWPRSSKMNSVISPTCDLSIDLQPIQYLQKALKVGCKIVVVPAHSANKGMCFVEKSLSILDTSLLVVFLTGLKIPLPDDKYMHQSNILKLGWLSDNEYSWLLNNASCLVFLSEYEGFGIPIIEAKQVGLPVVISNDPALIETSNSYAVIVDPFSPRDVSNAINTAVKVGKRIPVKPEKDWHQVAAEIEQFL